jgi:hypothetical protein
MASRVGHDLVDRAMKRSLLAYARAVLNGDQTLLALDCPMLLWEVGERSPEAVAESLVTANDGTSQAGPRPDNPLVLPLRSEGTPTSAGGISIGRSESNDVVIENPSVSRFHALIHRDLRTQTWTLTDASSRNGTWVEGKRVGQDQAVPLPDGAALRLGDAVLRFYLPQSFYEYVKRKLETS